MFLHLLARHSVQTFMFPPQLISLTLENPWLFLLCHHEVDILVFYWNTSLTIGWMSVQRGEDINGSQKIHYKNCAPPALHLTPSTVLNYFIILLIILLLLWLTSFRIHRLKAVFMWLHAGTKFQSEWSDFGGQGLWPLYTPFSWTQYFRNTLRVFLLIWFKCLLWLEDEFGGQRSRSLWSHKTPFWP